MRVSKEPEERKKEIIETAMKLFAKRGYKHTQIKDIVGSIGVAQGLFYYYFKSKEEVMEAVAEEYAKKILYSVEVTINSRDTVLEKLDEVAKSFIMMSQDQEEIFIEIQNADDGIIHEKVFKYLIEKLIPKIVEIVKIGNESGECNCKNPELYTQILLYGVSEKLNKVSSEKKMEIFISNLSALKNFVIKIYGIRDEQKNEQTRSNNWNDTRN